MKATILPVIGSLLVGFGAGWVLKPSPAVSLADSAEAVSVSDEVEKIDGSSDASGDLAVEASSSGDKFTPSDEIEGGDSASVKATKLDSLDDETRKQMEKAVNQQSEMMKAQLGKKFDSEMENLISALSLDPAQEASLREFYKKRLEVISLDGVMMGGTEPGAEAMTTLAGAFRGDGLTEHMEGILSPEQAEILEKTQAAQHTNKVESLAMKKLGGLQEKLLLNPEQKDQMYELFLDDAEERIENESDMAVVQNGMMSAMGMQIDMGDMDMDELNELQTAEMGADQEEGVETADDIYQRIVDKRAAQVVTKVEKASGVLDDNQLKQYQSHLESGGAMLDMILSQLKDAADSDSASE